MYKKWVAICRRYWILAAISLAVIAVIPSSFLDLNPLFNGAVAKEGYIKTESIEKCLLLYRFNHSYLTKSQQLIRIMLYKYKHSDYYRSLTMSVGIIAVIMAGTAYLLAPDEKG